jgi:carbonic anhydrase
MSIKVYNVHVPNQNSRIRDNLFTVQVNTIGPYYVANGGLSSVYSTAQFHFHWGSHDRHGSEHQVDGQSFPLEVRIFINEKKGKKSQPQTTFRNSAPITESLKFWFLIAVSMQMKKKL